MKLSDNYLIDLPEGYRHTSPLWETGERAMDMANEEFVLAELRALDGVTEGTIADHYVYSFTVVEEGDWYHVGNRIVYRCPLSDEAFKLALRIGSPLDAETDERTCPVLDLLVDIKRQLANYPVLDDERYDELCLEARVEMVKSSAPQGCTLTDAQAERIVWALSQHSWPPEGVNEEGIEAKYQVEWTGDNDYHVHGNSGPYDPDRKHVDLDDAVKHACRKLGIWPHWNNRRRRAA